MAEQIKCLGKSFASDDERREYYRDELRKLLPELKKIDGFPIGEDEDIIAISDPPYYTACPNPWLNDFISVWERDKELIANRKPDFNIENPYAIDVSEGKNNAVYSAHSYHTKVPHPAVMRYLLHYTQPGDIVFDGFAGTGMTSVAAQVCSKPDTDTKMKIEKEWSSTFGCKPHWGIRKSICSELSPIATFLADKFTSTEEIETFDKKSRIVLNELKEQLKDLYKVKYKNDLCEINYVLYSDVYLCSNCNSDIVYWGEIFDYKNDTDFQNAKCSNCGSNNNVNSLERKFVSIFDEILSKTIQVKKTLPVQINIKYKRKNITVNITDLDEDYNKKLSNIKVEGFFPTSRMLPGDESRRNDRTGITNIHHFYSKENLKAISVLYEITHTHKFPFFGFFNTAWHATLMRRYNSGGGHRPKSGTLYIPSLSSVGNVYNIYENKLSQLRKFLFATKGFEIHNRLIQTSSSNKVNLADNSVDYIFTDPPFGANIMYSELNFIWENWLKVRTNAKKEAIENKTQEKGKFEYQALMIECFQEFYRILKPNKWMTVEFSNPSAAIWNSIQTALQRTGFIVANVSALDKKQGSINSYTTPTAVKQDLVISCYKPSNDFEKKFMHSESEIKVWDFITEHLHHLPIHIAFANSTTSIIERSSKILFDRLISFFLMRGMQLPLDAKDFHEGIKQRYVERDGMFFLHDQVSEYDEKKLKAPNVIQIKWQIATESEGIEWLRRELLDKPLKYQDIQPRWMQAITAIRKGDILPELKEILQQNFIEEENGTWRVPDMNEAKDREIIRNKVLLKEFNEYLEVVNNQKTKRMKEVRVEALRAGFKLCWERKDFENIVKLSDKIPQNVLLEDEQLLMYYDIAKDKV